ncbi:FAD-dependent oxidoreductase [Chloroflexota bacterium]
MNETALVIGGGITGMQAALDIANAGFNVTLVESSPSLGGHMLQLSQVFPTLDCPQCIGTPKMVEVASHPNIELLSYAEVVQVSGKAGEFKVTIRKKPRYVDEARCTGCGICQEKCPFKVDSQFNLDLSQRKAVYTLFPQAVPNTPVIDREHCAYFLKGSCRACEQVCEPKAIDFSQEEKYLEREAGAIVVATGYDVFDARLKPELGYGVYPNVITSLELERLDEAGGPTQGRILVNGKEPQNVVFIQCVGSRDKPAGNEYCSRICCMSTAKQAYYIKRKLPEARVTVCYIDIRAYGKGYEQFYERVQKEGVIYRRGIVSEIYRRGDRLMVRAEDTLSGEFFEEEADLVVLAVGLVPAAGTRELAEMLGLQLGCDNFFLEAHPKLGLVESGVTGIFLAGCCQSPNDITNSVTQGSAAAAMACDILSKVRVSA